MSNVLITGGTGRIGSVLVRELLSDGHNVVFTSRSLIKGEKFIKENSFDSNRTCALELDLLDETQLKKGISKLPINIDVVIHNARAIESLRLDAAGLADKECFSSELEMAVIIPYTINNELIKNGHTLKDIVFISSMYGVVAPTPSLYENFEKQSPIQYGVAKAAQIHMVKELAVRFATKSIRVNAVSYGGVDGRVNADFVLRYNKLNPLGRMLNDADLYPPIQYIVNNPNLNMTGENIKVDGGWTLW